MECNTVLAATRRWVSEVVIGLNLCPFARRELVNERIRFVATDANSEEGLLTALQEEMMHLDQHPEVETTLLVHPDVLTDFMDYNDFLDAGDGLLVHLEMDGEHWIARFYPDNHVGGYNSSDAETYNNLTPQLIAYHSRRSLPKCSITCLTET